MTIDIRLLLLFILMISHKEVDIKLDIYLYFFIDEFVKILSGGEGGWGRFVDFAGFKSF